MIACHPAAHDSDDSDERIPGLILARARTVTAARDYTLHCTSGIVTSMRQREAGREAALPLKDSDAAVL